MSSNTIRKPEHRSNCSRCGCNKTKEEKLCNTWTFECERCRVITKNKYKYKITRTKAEALYNATNCVVCETRFTKTGPRRRCIDHCHETGEVRGAICRNCNTGLGMFGDSVELIQAAIKYLNLIKYG